MKSFITVSLAAMAAGASAHNHHQHAHLHKKDAAHAGSPVEKREPDVVTHYVVGATDVVYELNGKVLKPDEAKAGIDGGDFVVVGESEPTYTPPPPPPEPTTTSIEPVTTSSSVDLGAQFIESISSEPAPEPTTSSAPPPPPAPKPKPSPKPKPVPKPAAPSNSGGNSGGSGLDTPFPDGTIDCSQFPSDYGAVPLDWLKFQGWAGLQYTPGFTLSALSISEIHTGISGSKCTKGCMCSYACPPGYQKTQWPAAQGADNESIGGLLCADDGKLYLTRSKTSKYLCEKGAGGVSVDSELSEEVAICRTDYPGTEGMYIPTIAEPGSSIEITNPVQDEYYIWDGQSTSAQYYINPLGVSKEIACEWKSPNDPPNTGNWAPAILGVGKAADGITYISLFQNKPTSYEKLDFNIEITGDVNSKCGYSKSKQQFTGGSDPDGCTTGMQSGGKATIRFY